jgi:NADH-quinone oxidoreductase subunit E
MARVLSADVLAEISRLRGLYVRPQSALLPALHAAQAQTGYLSDDAIGDVAEALGVPSTEVASVATFYSMFTTEPLGRHRIRICTNLSCYLCGAEEILEHVCRRLGVGPGETTADRRFTVEAVECLAACEEAPVMLVDTGRHPRATAVSIDTLLDGLA